MVDLGSLVLLMSILGAKVAVIYVALGLMIAVAGGTLIEKLHMEQAQYSKLLSALPPVDIIVTMGCNVACPALPCKHREDWGLEDPTGGPDEVYLSVIETIEQKILKLKENLYSLSINQIV